jgi:hypothetical protein
MARRFAVLALAGAVLALLIPTQAQSFTYGRLVGGQVKSALAYGSGSSWCLVDNGNTEFQINQTNTKAVISFAEVIYFDGATYYSLNGQTRLTFSSATGGIIRFKQPPASRLIPLSQVDQYLGLAGRIRNGAGFDFFGRS